MRLWPKDYPEELQLDLHHHIQVEQAATRLLGWSRQKSGGLILMGGTGTGKTTLAKIALHSMGGALAQLPTLDGIKALFIDEPKFFASIRAGYGDGSSERQIAAIRASATLFLDDVGVGHIKEGSLGWAQDLYWRILDQRDTDRTFITTNLRPSQLKARLGQRAFSRLKGLATDDEFFVDMFEVPDYRGVRV